MLIPVIRSSVLWPKFSSGSRGGGHRRSAAVFPPVHGQAGLTRTGNARPLCFGSILGSRLCCIRYYANPIQNPWSQTAHDLSASRQCSVSVPVLQNDLSLLHAASSGSQLFIFFFFINKIRHGTNSFLSLVIGLPGWVHNSKIKGGRRVPFFFSRRISRKIRLG